MRETGVLMSSAFAAPAGAAGVIWLATAELVWHKWQLKPTTSDDASEVSVGTGALALPERW